MTGLKLQFDRWGPYEPIWASNLIRTPDPSETQCWGQRSQRGHAGSTRGQIAKEYPMATKFGMKNLWPEWNTILGLKVTYRSCGVNQRSKLLKNTLWQSHLVRGTLTGVEQSAGVTGHTGVMWGWSEVKLGIPYMATKFSHQNPWPEWNIMLWSKFTSGS